MATPSPVSSLSLEWHLSKTPLNDESSRKKCNVEEILEVFLGVCFNITALSVFVNFYITKQILNVLTYLLTTLKVPGCTVCRNEFHSALKDFLECLQIIRLSFKKKKRKRKVKKINPPQTASKYQTKRSLQKNSFSGQPKGLKSTHNNTTEDFKCVMCVFSTVLYFKPFTKGHTACRTKSEISLKVRLWSPERVFGKEMNASPQNGLMGLKERQHSSPTII